MNQIETILIELNEMDEMVCSLLRAIENLVKSSSKENNMYHLVRSDALDALITECDNNFMEWEI